MFNIFLPHIEMKRDISKILCNMKHLMWRQRSATGCSGKAFSAEKVHTRRACAQDNVLEDSDWIFLHRLESPTMPLISLCAQVVHWLLLSYPLFVSSSSHSTTVWGRTVAEPHQFSVRPHSESEQAGRTSNHAA